jgi:hypothetical protein
MKFKKHTSWKDFDIEALAPFRRFLLAAFDSYSNAWMFLTRFQCFGAQRVRDQLVKIVERIEGGRDEHGGEYAENLKYGIFSARMLCQRDEMHI